MEHFIDTSTISAQAGHGGKGCSSFRREKFVPLGGPDGGDGGNGGNILIKASEKHSTLFHLKDKKIICAQNGKNGSPQKKSGKNGLDQIILVPIGTLIYDENSNLVSDICTSKQEVVVAKGGKGGKGNQHFSNSRKQAPTYSQQGLPGESCRLRLELRLLADVGLIGMPNAGKSTLLKQLTQANAKIGAYPFTTLSPNIGTLQVYDQHITLADIPGLIEGASDGQGLGNQFLRHIDRTRILLHVLDCASFSVEEIWKNYAQILTELEKSNYQLLQKPQLVVLNKHDAIQNLSELETLFEKKGLGFICVSGLTGYGITKLKQTIQDMVQKDQS